MYTPPHNRQEDPDEVFAFMREFPFATLVTSGADGMTATHAPLNVTRTGAELRISGHIAKANAQVRHLQDGREALAIFAAPHAYVSPSNYEPGQWVPTWNYVAVHAYGTPRVAESRDAKLAVLAETVAAYDAGFQDQFDSYPGEFVDGKLKGIVAFEFAVSRVDARWKLSQDRQPAERDRIVSALRESQDALAAKLAGYMDATAEAAAR